MTTTRASSPIAAAACAAVLTFLGPGAAFAADASVWPLVPQPEVVAGFDPPELNWNAGHRGVDLRGAPGQSVRAARAGQIIFAGRLAGLGVVVVSHADTRTTYQPVETSVRVGEHVLAGQKVGVLGAVGSHCWPQTCLHWGLIRGVSYLDPLTLVGAGPVRLLPLLTDLAASGLSAFGFGRPTTPSVGSAMPGDVTAGMPAAADLR